MYSHYNLFHSSHVFLRREELYRVVCSHAESSSTFDTSRYCAYVQSFTPFTATMCKALTTLLSLKKLKWTRFNTGRLCRSLILNGLFPGVDAIVTFDQHYKNYKNILNLANLTEIQFP